MARREDDRWAEAHASRRGYDRLLASVNNRADEIEPRPVLVHWPHVGSAYDGTVIVGQALRGWPDDFRASDFQSPDGRARVIETARERPDRPEPMDWIATHHVRSSPFWKTARLLAEALDPHNGAPWYARWCWLNLFPCAPDDPPDNPGGALKEARIRSWASCWPRTSTCWAPAG